METDELLHQKGQEAESFIRSLEEGNKYFYGVLADINQEIMDSIVNLKPSQKDEFSFLKSQLECLYEPIRRIERDIEIGKQAWARMNGVEDKTQGIL
jgi:hypothetical protein